MRGMPYLVNVSGSQTLLLRSSCEHNGGRENFDHKSPKVVLKRKFSGENHRNARKFKSCMTMDSRFTSGSQFGQIYPRNIAGYRNSAPDHPRQPTSTSASITLDENLSRLFECMRLEYGT